MEQVFDDLALKAGFAAQRLYAGSLLLDGPGVFVQAEGNRKLAYYSCSFRIWARDVELAEATRANLLRIVGDDRARDQLFVVDWRISGADGELRSSTFEEVADDVLLDEAYPMLGEPVQQFIERYVRAPESVLILRGHRGRDAIHGGGQPFDRRRRAGILRLNLEVHVGAFAHHIGRE